jgi:hypothetical protein
MEKRESNGKSLAAKAPGAGAGKRAVIGEKAEAKDVVGEGLGLERRKRGLEKEEELGLGLGSREGQLGNR